jgi:hypothetical protein
METMLNSEYRCLSNSIHRRQFSEWGLALFSSNSSDLLCLQFVRLWFRPADVGRYPFFDMLRGLFTSFALGGGGFRSGRDWSALANGREFGKMLGRLFPTNDGGSGFGDAFRCLFSPCLGDRHLSSGLLCRMVAWSAVAAICQVGKIRASCAV